MTIDEALDYIEDINSTVSWTKEQETDREFFENVEEWLEELKRLRLGVNYLNEKAYQQGRTDQRKEDEELNYHYQTSHECYMQGRTDILNAIKNDLHKLWIDETNKPYTDQGVIEGLYLGIQRCNWYLSDDKEQKNE